MGLRKSDLENMWLNKTATCKDSFKRELLLKTGRGGGSAARDYIHALCLLAELEKVKADYSNFNNVKEALAHIHPLTRFRWRHYSPCLAFRYDELKPKEQEAIFNDKNWVASRKENGVRCWVMYYKGQVKLYSRNYSDKDCGLNEYSENVYQNIKTVEDVFVVDTEIKFEPGANVDEELRELGIETSSKLEAMCALLQMYPHEAVNIQKKFQDKFGRSLVSFRMIAPLFCKGKNYVKLPLGEGIKDYNEVLAYGRELGFNLQPIPFVIGTAEEKKTFSESLIAQGEEGTVFWNMKGSYDTSDNRKRTSFVKLKRSLSAVVGLGDTIDAFITGFKMSDEKGGNAGLIGSLEASIYILEPDGRTKQHVVAFLPNLPLETKKRITMHDTNGNVFLDPQMLGMVVECDGQSFSHVGQRLTHPRLIRWRGDEKSQNDCIYTREFIDSQTDGIGV